MGGKGKSRGEAGVLTREVLGSPTFDSGLRGSNKLWQGSMWFAGQPYFAGRAQWSRKPPEIFFSFLRRGSAPDLDLI